MAKSSINVSIDSDIGTKAQEFFANQGMDLSTAINFLLGQAIGINVLPVEIAIDVPNEETKKAIENVKNGVGLSKSFNSVAELMDDLYADD